MTIHIHYKDNKCPKCSVLFIPFKKDFKCPNCNEPINEFFDFIPELIDSMKIHKEKYGDYMPPAWYVGSLTEHVQSIIFKLFDALERQISPNPSEFIADWLNKVKWGNQQYLQKHIEDIASAVYKIYKDDGEFKNIKHKKIEKPLKMKRIFKIFFP
jgi:hypothetical protein